MTTKLARLQSALDNTRRVPPPATSEPRQHQAGTATPPVPAPRQTNRVGKVNIAAWMEPDFKNSLRLVQARRPGSIQDLLEEALNDLFAKYDVPQVSRDL